MINYAAWQFWFNVANTVGLILLGAYTIWVNREKVTARRFKRLEDAVAKRVTEDDLDARNEKQENNCLLHVARTGKLELDVTKLNVELKNVPGSESIKAVHKRIDEVHGRVTTVQGQLENISGQLKGVGRNVDLIQEFLLSEKKK